MVMIETKNLTKKYGKQTVLDSLNMTIKQGSLTAYLGTNGAGKSTTVRLITQTLTADSGEILYDGKTNLAMRIGVVFQNSVLDAELSVIDNLLIRSAMYRNVSRAYVIELMEKTGVAAFAKKKYGHLSGGMRRKVDITRALINQPQFLFLDEPTTGLDPKSRQEIWQLLNHLKQNEGIGIFLTTHYLEEAESADYIYILEKGKLVEAGTAPELKAKYGKTMVWLKVKDKQALLSSISAEQIVSEDARGFGIEVADLAKTLDLLAAQKENLLDFSYFPIGMNEVFLNITGRELTNECDY